jgi:phosphonate transport system substrate-binding protein
MRRLTKLLSCIALTAGFAATAQAQNELRFAVTDVVGMETLQREWGPFQKALESKTGLKIAFFAVNNRTAAAEALRAKRVDFVFTGRGDAGAHRRRARDRGAARRLLPERRGARRQRDH